MSPNVNLSLTSSDPSDLVTTLEEITQTMAFIAIEPQPEDPFVTLVDHILPHQLDSIAWNHHESLFAFGSYEIDPSENARRIGNLYLARLCSTSVNGYTLLQTVTDLPGILDIKWNPIEEQCLAVGTSEALFIFKLETTNENQVLVKIATLSTFPVMVLYITWLNTTDILYSDSAGNVVTWTRTDGIGSIRRSELNKEGCSDDNPGLDSPDMLGVTVSPIHKYFVWFVHFDTEEEVIYSGDDAGYFRAFHLKNLTNPAVHAKHQFPTGVTSILTKRNCVAVGCYDDFLRIFTRTVDTSGRVTLSSSPLLEIDLGGTVWRTSWLPGFGTNEEDNEEEEEEFKLAVAAGRNGIHVITFNPEDWTSETTFCCLEHKGSLAYGLDIHANSDLGNYTVATVYFDSKTLHVFTLKP